MNGAMGIEWNSIERPVFLAGGKTIAYRDPCGHYHDGVFRVWHTQVHGEAGGDWVAATGVVESRDLVTWSSPREITPSRCGPSARRSRPQTPPQATSPRCQSCQRTHAPRQTAAHGLTAIVPLQS